MDTEHPKYLCLGTGNRHSPDKRWLFHDYMRHHEDIRLEGDLERFTGAEYVYFSVPCQRYLIGREHSRVITFEKITARDVLEHLDPKCIPRVLEFCWANLDPKGTLEIQVPQWGSLNAIVDPTHYRGFHLDSFDYWDPTTRLGKASQFYGRSPWRLETKEVVPRSDVNLRFVLRRL